MRKKLLRILAAAMCVCMVATACGGSNSSTNGGDSSNGDDASAVKDNLVIAVQTDMADKDPINGSTTNDTIKIKAQVYETLIERTVPDQEYKPLLAEKWEFNDDGTELTITLRDGVKFHNGETLTAEDCLFSLQCLRESANKSVTDHMDLDKSYVVDDKTFVIVMDQAYMPVIANLSYPTCVMFSKKGYEDGNGEWANMDIGTGPYTWGDWSIGNTVELNAFDDYYVEGQPAIKKVEFKVISEDGNRYIEVETGGADICYNLSGVDIAAAEANSDVQLFREYTMDNCYLSFNQREEPFTDVRVRQAIAYALDIDGAWNVCMDGVGQPAKGVLPDNVTDSIAKADSPYHVDYPVYQYNLEKAKELLAEAGYPNGFSCRYHVGHLALRQAYGEFFANALSQIGINVEIVALDAATNAQALKVEHNFDIYTWGIAPTNGDIDFANRFFYTDAPNNIFGYSDPEMDAMIDAAAQEVDTAKRSEMNAAIQKKVLDECIIVPIYQQEDIHCLSAAVKGFRWHIKQRGGMLAKGRLLGVQFKALLTDNLYFDIARHANEMALRLRDGFLAQGYEFPVPSPSNQQFPVMTIKAAEKLAAMGFEFQMDHPLDGERCVYRFVTSWATPEHAVDELLAALAQCK